VVGAGDGADQETNLDIEFEGVDYVAIPWLFKGLEITTPNDGEIRTVEKAIGKKVEINDLRVLVSEGNRHYVVAASMVIRENSWHNMESPFRFRSEFHKIASGTPVRRISVLYGGGENGTGVTANVLVESENHLLAVREDSVDDHDLKARFILVETTSLWRESGASKVIEGKCWMIEERDILTAYPDEALRSAALTVSRHPETGVPCRVQSL